VDTSAYAVRWKGVAYGDAEELDVGGHAGGADVDQFIVARVVLMSTTRAAVERCTAWAANRLAVL
jgi:hypothetical protein